MSAPSAQPASVQPYAVPGTNMGRGTLLALLTIPAGVAVWLVIWGMGFIAALVGALVAFLAVKLYVRGAGGITRGGALVVVAVTVVTMLLAFFAGLVLDAAEALGEVTDLGTWGAFSHEAFWPTFSELLPEVLPEYLPDFGLAALFSAAGSFSVLRSAFTAASAQTAPAAPQPTAPETQPAPEQL